MIDELDAGWNDVLRRAQQRRRARRLVVAAGATAAVLLGGGSALGVLLTKEPVPRLPKAADRSKVAVAIAPLSGRVLVQAAPWKGRHGVCYVLFVARTSGCSMWSRHGGLYNSAPPGGYTFDTRVASVTAQLANGRTLRMRMHRFPALEVTFFTAPPPVVTKARGYTLRDANGRVIARTHFR